MRSMRFLRLSAGLFLLTTGVACTHGTDAAPVPVVRTTVNLTPEAVEALREIARDRGTTVAEVIRRAIWIEKYLHDAQKAGSKVLIEDLDRALAAI